MDAFWFNWPISRSLMLVSNVKFHILFEFNYILLGSLRKWYTKMVVVVVVVGHNPKICNNMLFLPIFKKFSGFV